MTLWPTGPTRGLPLVENLLQDARYMLRMLVRSPGFASIAILTMALGIGATTAIFSVVDATLLHPLSYPEPNELVRVELDQPGVGARNVPMSVPEWKDLERSGIFEFVAPTIYGSVLVLTAVALAASYIPAMCAMRVNPLGATL